MKKSLICVIILMFLALGLMSGSVIAANDPTVSGKLTNADGTAISGITVALYDGVTLTASTKTASDGAYSLTATAGDYTLVFYGNGVWNQERSINLTANTTLDLTSEILFELIVPETVSVGDIYDLTFVLKNQSANTFPAQTFNITTEPTLIDLLSESSWSTPEIPSGQMHTTALKAVALVGGSENLVLVNGDGDEYTFELFVSGKGWYAGDAHTHSNYFDGMHSIRENVEASRELGYDFLYSTDHNMLPADHPYNQITAEYNGKFVNLMGTEVTTWRHTELGKDGGHMLSYRVNSVVDGYTAPGSTTQEASNRKWQDAVDNVKAQGGFMYAAHPFLKEYSIPDAEKYNVTGLTGIEVINWFARETESNAAAFLYWDALNAKGTAMYNGINNSDAHDKKYLGMVFNKGIMNSLTSDNINNMLEEGHFYGSNGPDLRFELGGVGMGDELKVNGKQTVRAYLSAYDSRSYLKSIVLYRMEITGDWMGSYTKTAVYRIDLAGQEKNFYETYLDIEIGPNEMYRVEVFSELCHHPVIRTANRYEGYAFSNPIWVHESTQNSITQLNSLSYSGNNGAVVTNGKGEAYIMLNSGDLDVNSITASTDSRTTSSIEYTAGGNGKSGVLSVTLKAEDGTERTLNYCVVSPDFI